MRKLLLLLTIASLPSLVEAQSTSVTLQVTDAGAQSWNNGTWAVLLVSKPGASTFGPPFNIIGGGSVPNQSQSGALSTTGGASMTLTPNASIAPTQSQWSFTVCPAQGIPFQCFTQAVIISGASQTVTLTPPTVSVTCGANVSAYADSEVSCGVGGQYYNLTLVSQRQCTSSNGTICSVWTIGGGGVIPNTPSPANYYNVKNYGAVGDAQKNSGSTVTNGSSTITNVPNAPYLASVVGKKIFCIGTSGLSALTPTIETITAFNSTSSITVSGAGNANATGAGSNSCVLYTQKETTAFRAAGNAALPSPAGTNYPFNDISSPGTVWCPPGGYVLDGPALVQVGLNANTPGVSFLGSGKHACRLYMSPDVAASGGAWIIATLQTLGTNIGGFSVDCSLMNIAVGVPGIMLNTDQHWTVKDVEQDGCGTSGDSQGQLALISSQNGYIDGYTVNGGAFGSPEPALGISGGNVIEVRNMDTTNPGNSGLTISASGGQSFANGPRSIIAGGITIENSIFDEGGVPAPITITSGSSVNLIGVTGLAGTTTSLNIGPQSSVYITDSNFAPFGGTCSGGNRTGVTISANSIIYATGSDFQSCGADVTGLSAAVGGPSTASFVNLGGNTLRNCPGGPPCPLVTPANYATLGFNGGIVQQQSNQMPSNTVYTVTGNLLATAQNLVQILLPVNQQLQNITAQSGGTTPANSSCATPPVITLSDGTRSATMTMTSGKTFWRSDVDAVTNITQVFAAGAVLTVSIGANTCATPPVNVAVTYNLQSVLNP